MADSKRAPRTGCKVLKGHNSRLVQDVYDNGDTDDWINEFVMVGVEGWRKHTVFRRLYSYQKDLETKAVDHGRPSPPRWGAGHLYTWEARREQGHVLLGEGQGATDGEAWRELCAVLKRKRLITDDEFVAATA
jgi:hypothetical protein